MFFFRKNRAKLTDCELLNRFVETGDSEYFGELYNRYIPLLYGVCLKYLEEPEAAQDAVMQIFEDLLHRVSNYEITEFRTWVYSVAKNHCLQQLRKTKREIRVDFNPDLMESEDILHLLEEETDEERLKALEHCLQKLPENQQISIRSFFMDEMSYADISDQTGFDLKRVKSYIQNGKRNLSICIEKRLK